MGEGTDLGQTSARPDERDGDRAGPLGRRAKGRTRPKVVRSPFRRGRVPPENREALIVEKAIRFFAANGFHGNTRDLARSIGISQPLLYHYFPNKQALIDRVFEVLCSGRWKAEWERWLADTGEPLARRLERFYLDYMDTVLTPEWTRIFFFAALRDMRLLQRNHLIVRDRILRPIVRELRLAAGTVLPDAPVGPTEDEIAWSLHAAIFHLAVRRWILDLPPSIGIDAAIRLEVGLFLGGAVATLAGRGRPRRRLRALAG